MECNKDEAARAKEIAEKKFVYGDILGARKFALKARNLFPGLEGLSQFIGTLDVYFSAEKKKSNSNPSKPSSFWTRCIGCKTQFEYSRNFLNRNLLCCCCKTPFYAVEMPSLPTEGDSSKRGCGKLKTDLVRKEAARTESGVSEKKGLWLASDAGSSSGNANTRLQRNRVVMNVHGRQRPNQLGMGVVSGDKTGNLGDGRIGVSGTRKNGSVGELSRFKILVAAKSRMEIQKNLSEWSVKLNLRVPNKKGKKTEMEKPKFDLNGVPKSVLTGGKRDGNPNPDFVDTKELVSLSHSNVDMSETAVETKLMIVPDPDFYNFDKDRIEKSFGENQVWAAYDEEDGMPRYYALIRSVISKRPFKMQISWLNSKNNDELGPMNWVGSGFPKTCGDFRVGKYQIYKSLNSFSHRVKWVKGARGVIQIYPKKGDVWALYRNWSPKWNEFTPNEVVQKYEMVELLEDYNKELGLTIAPLIKVVGFRSIFRQNLEVRIIPKEEIFRLSHQVPCYVFTGQEAISFPVGFRELDPAAMPLELLNVIIEDEERETMAKTKKAKKTEDLAIVDTKGMATNSKDP